LPASIVEGGGRIRTTAAELIQEEATLQALKLYRQAERFMSREYRVARTHYS